MVRICCIRSFGHFVARLQGSILQFNPEVGIFVSIAQSEQESLLQQAQAQFRMVSQVFPCLSAPFGLTEEPGQEAQPHWWVLPEEHGEWESQLAFLKENWEGLRDGTSTQSERCFEQRQHGLGPVLGLTWA